MLPFAGDDFRNQSSEEIQKRIEWMAKQASLADKKDIHVYPAGWLCAETIAGAMRLAKNALRKLRSIPSRANVFFGVDGWKNYKKGSSKGKNGYPFWVYGLLSNGALFHFQQLAINASETVEKTQWHRRPIQIHGKRISVVICGEMMTEDVQELTAKEKPDIVLLLAHQGIKLGRNKYRCWNYRIDDLRKRYKTYVFASEHTRNPQRHPHAWGISPYFKDWKKNDGLWIYRYDTRLS